MIEFIVPLQWPMTVLRIRAPLSYDPLGNYMRRKEITRMFILLLLYLSLFIATLNIIIPFVDY